MQQTQAPEGGGETTDRTADRTADRTTNRSGERRLAAPLLALFAGPMGHIALGYWQRACAWCAAGLAIAATCVISIYTGSPRIMWLTIGAAVVLRLSVIADVVRLRRLHPLPRLRAVVLIGIGFAIFYQILAVKVRTDLVEAFKIPSLSMSPTLEVGDHVFTRKSARVFGRGDVVVFGYPLDPTTKYIKRIVGVGGDVVAIDRGQLSINRQPVARQRLEDPCSEPDGTGSCTYWQETLDGKTWRVALSDQAPAHDSPPTVVPEGAFFVLGDNRDASSDSRVWGPVRQELIVGQPIFTWWSSGTTGVRWSRINQPIR